MPSATTGHAPSLEKYLMSLRSRGQTLESAVETLISLLKRRQIKGSEACAVATAHILLQVVAKSNWEDAESLIEVVSNAGRRLVQAQPRELAVGNIVRRVLGLIRDEAQEHQTELASDTASEALQTPIDSMSQQWPSSTYAKQDSAGDYLKESVRSSPRPALLSQPSVVNVPKNLFHILSASTLADAESSAANSGTSTPIRRGTSNQVHALRSEVIEGIEEIKDEISQADDQIAALAEVQIHPGETILLHHPTPTVERFVLRAAAKRKFTVWIAITDGKRRRDDGEPRYAHFRKKLQTLGCTAVNIICAGFMAFMPRVDKVILNAHAVLANGAVVGDGQSGNAARAAKHHGRTVIVLGGVYKLSPEMPYDEFSYIEWADPSLSANFADGDMVNLGIDAKRAVTELIPAEFINMYITNVGTHSRDHLSSVLMEHYKAEDIDFHLG